jgi:Xaa-Pro aminopeptidase
LKEGLVSNSMHNSILALSFILVSLLAFVDSVKGNADPRLFQTPPAPFIDENTRRAELASRRARVIEKIGPQGLLVLFSATQRIYTNDVDYHYRQENNLYYLTNLRQKGITLVIIPGNTEAREILFLPRRNPAMETWTGYMYSAEEARRISGIEEIWAADEFEPFILELRRRQLYRPKPNGILLSKLQSGATVTTEGVQKLFQSAMRNEASLFLLVPTEQESREFRREQQFASQWVQTSSGFSLKSAWPIFVELRQRKSDLEIKLLQHAIDITTEAMGRAMTRAGQLQNEYEVAAEIEYTYRRRNADHWGFPSIVGAGANATTLHYDEAKGPIGRGDLLLLDIGAEYEHYSADVTRTFPVSGKFSQAQAEIYSAVLAAQEASMARVRTGILINEVHMASVESIKESLLKLGLITDRNSNQYRVWFMHSTCHWLGMNVHDVGRSDAKLEPGMVFTIEPGIYIRQDALDYLPKTPEMERFIAAVRPAFEKYKNIGVRIEDDILVTSTGYRNLSGAVPRTINDLEKFIQSGSRPAN